MTMESISRLCELTGTCYRTARKRLEGLTPEIRGRASCYESRIALPLILQSDKEPDSGGVGSLEVERAKLAAAQRQQIELKMAAQRGELLPAAEVEATWTRHIMAARSRLLAIPGRVAFAVVGQHDVRDIERIIRDEVHRALHELSDSTGEAPLEPDGAPNGRP